MTYQDQISGLGPEEVQMVPWLSPTGEMLGRWMAHVEEWERSGKKGDGPPGTKQTVNMKLLQEKGSTLRCVLGIC